MYRIAALAIIAAFVPATDAAEVYKCTSADGKVYYSGKPCPASDKRETVRVPRPSSGDEAEAPARPSIDERIAAAEDPVEKAQLELQKKQCEVARAQLDRYEEAPYLIERKADGTERRLSEEETAAEKAKLQTMLQEQC